MFMKKIYKVIVIISLFQIYILMSCFPFGKCPDIICADITSFSVNNIDNTGEFPILQQNTKIPAKAYAVKLNFSTKEEVCLNTEYNSWLSSNNVYALSCESPHLINPIEKISIYSTKDFDINHPAGIELNDLFINIENDYFLESEIINNLDIFFYLDNIPEIEQEAKFIVNIELADGIMHTDTTETVILTL